MSNRVNGSTGCTRPNFLRLARLAFSTEKLQSQQHTEVLQEIVYEQESEEEEEVISASEIKKILGMWERASQFVEKKLPEKVLTGRASALFNDTCLTHFRNILKKRKKQTSMHRVFLKRLQVIVRKAWRKRLKPVMKDAVTKFKQKKQKIVK